eukprot:TRINITY_DN8326_c0_g1_i2.p1 TRINITY_DN8326_c0_g1~~TRINITY_DN8326_c0_g1_i2.p1  ORF type:complete len:236 (-),score=79.90 TRINITY_DN8326_c0_g1_i2:70-777(-)
MKAAQLFLLAAAWLNSVSGIVLKQELQAVQDAAAQEQQRGDRFFAETFAAQETELLKLQQLSHPAHHYPAPPELNFKPMKTKTDLLPALAMLKGLYEDGKDRIGKLNSREEESKTRFADQQKHHDEKLATIEGKFKSKHLSKAFHDDELKDEKRIFSYWTRVRARQHRQFLSAVKIQHGTMKRVSTMIDLYEKALAGKTPDAEIRQQLSQDKETQCCDAELRELRRERAQFEDSP